MRTLSLTVFTFNVTYGAAWGVLVLYASQQLHMDAVGFGLRYRTPVGPVRLDLGYSINPPYFFGFKGTQQDLVNAGVAPCSPPSPAASQCAVQNVSHLGSSLMCGSESSERRSHAARAL